MVRWWWGLGLVLTATLIARQSARSPSLTLRTTLPPTPSSLRAPYTNTSNRTFALWETHQLIAELRRREYTWEALSMAGLTWSDMTEIELLSWLKRHRRKFADVLEKTGLSFQSVSTVRLLKELSKRRDLGNALLETGLGAGADFDCAQDESPRDGGCQVRCQHGDCTRAQSVCGQISHCVRIDVNRDKSWATLKSLQVYSPRPAPTCDGYVFSAKGGDPQPLDAPVIVKLEVVVPREDWCYRDTAFSEAVQAAYRHERPDRNCTMARCFDVQRCTHAAEGPLPLFVGVETPKGEDMVRLPECLRQTERQAIVDSPDKACALLPTVNMNCQWDQCDPETHSLLLALPSWLHGRNHIIWVRTSMSVCPLQPHANPSSCFTGLQ